MESSETFESLTSLRKTRTQFREKLSSTSLLSAIPVASAWLILSFVVALVLFVVYMTFVPGLPTQPGLTLQHWRNVANDRLLREVIPNTLIVGFGTIFVAAFFALPLSWLLNRTSIPFRDTLTTLIAVVVIVPGFVKAMGWVMLVNDRIGILNNLIAGLFGLEKVPITVVNSPFGIAWVMGLMFTPTLFFLVSGSMRAMDPVLEEAAAVAGQSHWGTFWRVNLPLVVPGVFAGMIYVFMTAISVFEVPALLGAASGKVPVLATELFFAVRPGGNEMVDIAYGAAGVYGAIIAAPSMLALYFYLRLLSQARRFEVITGKGYRPRDIELGNLKWVGLGFIFLYMALAVVLPLLVLVWASLLPYLQMPSLQTLSKVSFANYRDFHLTLGGASVFVNTFILMAGATSLVLFFGLMVSWVVIRTRIRFYKVLDMIAMLPHAIPGLVFAFALFILGLLAARWLPWLPVQGTLGIIILANVISHLSYVTRITNSALVQVQSDLEECAQLCGLNNVSIMWRIVAPLIKPSLIFAGLWTAMLTFREVTMALFLTESHNRVLAVTVWQLWQGGNLGIASAGAVAMVVIMGGLILFTLRIGGSSVHRDARHRLRTAHR
jgi:iron(III) transport system permease protein